MAANSALVKSSSAALRYYRCLEKTRGCAVVCDCSISSRPSLGRHHPPLLARVQSAAPRSRQDISNGQGRRARAHLHIGSLQLRRRRRSTEVCDSEQWREKVSNARSRETTTRSLQTQQPPLPGHPHIREDRQPPAPPGSCGVIARHLATKNQSIKCAAGETDPREGSQQADMHRVR